MDEGGEWKNEIWADSCVERRIKLQFQGVGARLLLLERRNGLARGNYNRLIEDDRFSQLADSGRSAADRCWVVLGVEGVRIQAGGSPLLGRRR